MAKRGPQSVLNHDNWDNEEDGEDAGIFKQATKTAMEQRVIKKAKRRGEDGGTGAFGGFGGFGGLASRPALNQNTTAKTTNSTSFKLTTATTTDPVFKPKLFSGGAAAATSAKLFSGGAAAATSLFGNVEKSSSAKSESKDNSTYVHGLKSLNESVLAWIKQHVDKNPYIILTPIFKDYEKYLATLESKESSSTTTTTTTNGSGSTESSKAAPLGTSLGETTTKSVFASPLSKQPEEDKDDSKKEEEKEISQKKAPAAAFTFGSSSTNGEGFKFSSSSTPTTGFSFGKTSTTSASSSAAFTFGQSSVTTATSGFSFGTTSTSDASTAPAASTAFGGAAGFSFGTLAANSMAAQASGSDNKGQEDDEYVPPKPEVKEIKEDGSLYSKRCKLFYQKDGQWAERGVGNVHIKPLEETKTQILIRADTNLGNILLNIMVTSGLPISRQGKNNLLLVCVPNPPIKEGQEGDQKPISMLIRVKTGAEADELLTTLEERKALL